MMLVLMVLVASALSCSSFSGSSSTNLPSTAFLRLRSPESESA